MATDTRAESKAKTRQCATCGVYLNSTKVPDHQRKCKGCEICQVFFTIDTRKLKFHQDSCTPGNNHNNQRPFACSKCHKTFSNKFNRNRHEDSHMLCPFGCGEWILKDKNKVIHHERNYHQLISTNPPPPIQQTPAQNPPTIQEQIQHGGTPPVFYDSADTTDMPIDPALQATEQAKAMIAEYIIEAEAALRKSNDMYPTLLLKAPEGRRYKNDVKEIIRFTKDVTVGQPITVEEALQLGPDERPNNKFIICDMSGAIRLFDSGPPTLPILIIGWENENGLKIESFLDLLLSRNTLDVHDFGTTVKRDPVPVTLPATEAVALFKQGETDLGLPLNALNLSRVKDNNVPKCLENRTDYQSIKLTRQDNGKNLTAQRFNDLEDSTEFHLLATKGAMHLPHIDRHGVYTTALNEEGEKLWITWPNVGLAGLKDFCETNEAPKGGIAIHIQQGSLLIQPPNTLHAPITLETCLMTGTMYWNTTHLLDILRYTKACVEYPALTNEAMSPQFIPKMETLLKLWKGGYKGYSWPPNSQYDECVDILEWLKSGCNCGGSSQLCQRWHCACAKAGRDCDQRCHVGRDKCLNNPEPKTGQTDAPAGKKGIKRKR